jgi:hypothetical protein
MASVKKGPARTAGAKKAAGTKAPVKKAAPSPRSAKPAKPAAKPADKASAKPATQAPAADKADKAKKPKLVRDSFTIPKVEYAVLDELKQRAARLGHPMKKSEVLRAGIKALAGMTDASLLATLSAVPTVKTGRPAKA